MTETEQRWREEIRAFIEANMCTLDDDVRLRDDDNIFAKGYVGSLFAMRLLGLVETLSGSTVADEDILLANFSSIDAMVALIRRQTVPA
jgi:hypothetical protein